MSTNLPTSPKSAQPADLSSDAGSAAPKGSEPSQDADVSSKSSKRAKPSAQTAVANNVRKLREDAMMSKAELARRAGVSPLTIDRVEAGMPCRMDTKRKILEALGLSPAARTTVWPELPEPSGLLDDVDTKN